MQTDELTPRLFCNLSAPIFSPNPSSIARYDVMGQFYEIVSLRRVGTPPGANGANWHRYVIAFDGNETIHGFLQGRIKNVTKEVEEIVAQLNQRRHKSAGF
jgi:hypothetical protein